MSDMIVYDIETFKNLFVIGYKRLGDKKVTVKYWFDEVPYSEIKEVLEVWKDNTVIGYNNYSFDDVVMEYLDRSIEMVDLTTNDIFNFVQSLITGSFNGYTKHPRSIDVFKLLDKSLKYNGAVMGMKIDAFFSDKEKIFKRVDKSELETIIDYNINDIEVTEAIYNRLKGDIDIRVKYALKYNLPYHQVVKNNAGFGFRIVRDELGDSLKLLPKGNDLTKFKITLDKKLVTLLRYFGSAEYNKYLDKLLNTTLKLENVYQDNYGKPRTVKKLTTKETNKVKFTIKEDDLSLEFGIGGLHSKESALNVKGDIEGWDVQSYYPNNLINQLGNEYKPLKDVTKKMLDLRIKAKKLQKDKTLSEDERQKWSDINATYKIALNGGIYGKLGDVNSPLYNPKAMVTITIYGQHALYLLYRMLKKVGVKVFSINTDGVEYIKNGVSDTKIKKVIKIWQNVTNLILDFDSYDSAHHQSVNAYTHIRDKKVHKSKGVFIGSDKLYSASRLDTQLLYPIVYDAVNKYLATNDLEAAINIIKNKDNDLLKYCNVRMSNGGALLIFGKDIDLNKFLYPKKPIPNEYKLIPKAERVKLYNDRYGVKKDPLELYKQGNKDLFNMVYDINNPKLEKVYKNGTAVDLEKLKSAGYNYEIYSNVLRYVYINDSENKLYSFKDGRALGNATNIKYLKEDIRDLKAKDLDNLDYDEYIKLFFDIINDKLKYQIN
jgi:hypothetical protein